MTAAASRGEMRPGPRGAYLAKFDNGVTVGTFPGTGMAFVEGRLAPMLSGDESDRTLRPPIDLVDGQDAIWQLVADTYGITAGTPTAGVRRADLSVDVGFRDSLGVGFLGGLGSLDPPRYKTTHYRDRGQSETVNLITAKRGQITLRAYDKGIEQGTGRRGETVRIERPTRYGKAAQMQPRTWSEQDMGEIHAGGLAPFRGSVGDLYVASPVGIAHELADRWRRGDLTYSEMRRLTGYCVQAQISVPLTRSEARVAQLDRKRLRELGLAVTDWEAPSASVPVGAVLDAVASAWE